MPVSLSYMVRWRQMHILLNFLSSHLSCFGSETVICCVESKIVLEIRLHVIQTVDYLLNFECSTRYSFHAVSSSLAVLLFSLFCVLLWVFERKLEECACLSGTILTQTFPITHPHAFLSAYTLTQTQAPSV